MTLNIKKPFKDGDIFKWSYADTERHCQDYAYWATSRIAIFNDGWLADTWSSSNNPSWLEADAKRLLKLRFVANLNDLENISESNARYFNQENIINLTHSNSYGSQIYVKKGAVRCLKTTCKLAEKYLSDMARGEEWAKRRHIDAQEILSKIEAGQPIEEIYIPDWKPS